MRYALLAVVLVACSSPAPAESTDQASEPIAKAAGPVIATIATADAKVSILGGMQRGQPLRVVVRNAEGTIVADGITVDELRRTNPTLGILVTNATASNDGTYLDASR